MSQKPRWQLRYSHAVFQGSKLLYLHETAYLNHWLTIQIPLNHWLTKIIQTDWPIWIFDSFLLVTSCLTHLDPGGSGGSITCTVWCVPDSWHVRWVAPKLLQAGRFSLQSGSFKHIRFEELSPCSFKSNILCCMMLFHLFSMFEHIQSGDFFFSNNLDPR